MPIPPRQILAVLTLSAISTGCASGEEFEPRLSSFGEPLTATLTNSEATAPVRAGLFEAEQVLQTAGPKPLVLELSTVVEDGTIEIDDLATPHMQDSVGVLPLVPASIIDGLITLPLPARPYRSLDLVVAVWEDENRDGELTFHPDGTSEPASTVYRLIDGEYYYLSVVEYRQDDEAPGEGRFGAYALAPTQGWIAIDDALTGGWQVRR